MKAILGTFAIILAVSSVVRAELPYPTFPAGVVAAYLNEDAAGSGWSSETFPRLIHYAVWPDAPGWDTITVIKSFAILDTTVSGNKAKVKVVYGVLGQLGNDTFKKAIASEAATYSLSRANGQWTIEEPQLMPHIAVGDVIRLSKSRENQTPELKVSLAELAKLTR